MGELGGRPQDARLDAEKEMNLTGAGALSRMHRECIEGSTSRWREGPGHGSACPALVSFG